MKQYIISFLVIVLLMWYSGIFTESLIVDHNRVNYSSNEARELNNQGIINKLDLANKKYYSEHVVKFISKRSYIPFVYNRDTVYDGGLQYYSRPIDQ